MSFSGSLIQNAIYVAQQPPEWPITADDWEQAAAAKLDPGAYGYIAGAAGAESTAQANLDAFRRHRIRPRMLSGNASRDLSVEVLGLRSPAPFLYAPIGVLSIAHEDAEPAVAEASATSGVPMVLSGAATHSLEEVAATGCPRWYQLYWPNDRELCASFVSRAEAAGYSAIVVTLDTLTLGWRPRDLRGAYLPFLKGEGCGVYFSDPVFLSRLAQVAGRGYAHRQRRRCSRTSRTSAWPGTTSTGCAPDVVPLLVKGSFAPTTRNSRSSTVSTA